MLSSVSETALITLKSRVIHSQNQDFILDDPMASLLLDALKIKLQDSVKSNVFRKNLPQTLTRHIAMRARKYDQYTKAFLSEYRDGLIVSLGCGFDTRFWRTNLTSSQYIEIDLPNVITLKKALLKEGLPYEILGVSVLDDQWIQTVKDIQNHHVLFLAEGLLMYLPEKDVINLFKHLADNFNNSQFIFETVQKKYTQGLYKKMVEKKMQRVLSSSAGASYNFGINNAYEIETYHPHIKVDEEWSYFEDDDIKPVILKAFKHFKTFTRSQWTVRAHIE